MNDKEKLEKVEMRLVVVKEKAYSKPKISKEDKEELKRSIESIADSLSEIMCDETISAETKSRIASTSRKQLYNLKQIIESLQNITHLSKEIVG